MGRKSDYDQKIADRICLELSQGKTLREVCRPDDMPPESTVRLWALDDRGGFAAHYARAREIGYQSMADELIEIADDGSNDWMDRKRADGTSEEVENKEVLNRSRLRVDTRKWLLAKALPKLYGDKVTNIHEGGDKPIETKDVSARELLADRLAGLSARTGPGEASS